MKRLASLLLSTMIVLCGCVPRDGSIQSEKFKIVASFYPVYAITKNIVQDATNVELTNMTEQSGGCLHDYTLLPEDMLKLENADVLICSGDDSIQELPGNLLSIDANTMIEGSNEHPWMSFSGAISMAQVIAEELGKLDVKNKAVYAENADAFKETMKEKQAIMLAGIAGTQNKNVMIADKAFDSLVTDLGLTLGGDLSGGGHGENVSYAIDYLTIIETAKSVKPVAVLVAENEMPPSVEIVVGELSSSGIDVLIVGLSPILSGDGNADDFFEQYDENFKKILAALR